MHTCAENMCDCVCVCGNARINRSAAGMCVGLSVAINDAAESLNLKPIDPCALGPAYAVRSPFRLHVNSSRNGRTLGARA